jgi:hypothetical protein
MLIAAVLVCLAGSMVSGKSLKAPPGLFKDLNDEIVADAIIINGKQLFIDDYIIEELKGAEKVLNQPTKDPANPLIVPDRPWEPPGLNRGAVMYDKQEKIYKMWYVFYSDATERQFLCYATSPDGIAWQKPLINQKDRSNVIPGLSASNPPCVFKDPAETAPRRRYKMLYGDNPDRTAKTYSTNAAYSPDGIHWTPEPSNPIIPFSDTLSCPFRDPRTRRYVAYLRYGPPNTRIVSRIESRDFIHWSPKVTIFSTRTKMDRPFATIHYGMKIMPYEGIYLGLLEAYHGETIQPIPKDKEPWMDKTNEQLVFSRNGLTWLRVGRRGAIPHGELNKDLDWKKVAEQATFIPYGRHKKDWDWGSVYSFQPPLVVDDEIRIYYLGHTGRHWASYHGDKRTSGIGLARLRLDGFVSINAAAAGTMTTKKFVFIGDTLEVNANAKGGSIVVEALGADGKVIEGFSKTDCMPITTDNIQHVLKWKDKDDCHLIQARPIRLRFHLKKAKLYSFTPCIRHKHYVQSYD